MEVTPALVTAVAAAIVVQTALAVSMLVASVAYGGRARFLKHLALASALAAVGYSGYALIGRVADVIPVLLGNGSFIAVGYFATAGAAVASGRKTNGPIVAAGLLTALLLLLLFFYPLPSFGLRNLVVTGSVAVCSAVSAVYLFSPKDQTKRKVTKPGAWVFGAYSTFYVFRATLLAHALVARGLSATLSARTEVFLLLVALMLFVVLGISFFTMMGGFLVQEQERTAERNAYLLRELQHRTKNNMALISSIVSIQEGEVKDPAATEALTHLKARLGTVTKVYQLLGRVEDGHHADIKEYLTDLYTGIDQSLVSTTPGVFLRLEAESRLMPSNKLIPVGLVVNELVTNALKHAFAPGKTGSIMIRFSSDGDHCLLEVADDGAGFNLEPTDGEGEIEKDSIGLTIIRALTEQLCGELSIHSRVGEGSRFALRFVA